MLFDEKSLKRVEKIAEENSRIAAALESLKLECGSYDKAKIAETKEFIAYLKGRSSLGYTKLLRYGNNIRDLSATCVKLAFLYKLMSDEQALHAAKEFLALICETDPWLYQGFSDGWNADLWTADISANMSVCYDTLKNVLSEEQKNDIIDSIINKGIYPIYNDWVNPLTRVHALDSMGHNWWSVIVAGMGVALVCIGKELAAEHGMKNYGDVLEETITGLLEWYNYPGNILQNKKVNFGKAGDYIEYVGYMNYAFSNLVIFDELLQKELSDDRIYQKELFEKIPQFLLAFSYHADGRDGFADFGDTPFSTKTGYPLFYFINKCEHDQLNEFVKRNYPVITHPYDFYFYPDENKLKEKELKNTLVYNDAGYAVMRSGYDRDASVFAMKAGDSWNHNHLDVGTFELIDRGHRFIADSGSCSYSNDLYRSYYTKPAAHNIITCAGKGQVEESIYTGTKFSGSFPVVLEGRNYRYMLADCTGAWQNVYQRMYRHVLDLDGVIVMVDDVQTYEDTTLTAQLHTAGKVSLRNDGFEISFDDASMRVYQFAKSGAAFGTKVGYLHAVAETAATEEYADPIDYVETRFKTEDKRQKLITCFVLPSSNRQIKEISMDIGEDMQILTIRDEDGKVQKLAVNIRADGRVMHRNGISEYKSIRTDAFLSYFEETNGVVSAYAMHNGSFLMRDGRMLVSSLIKQDVYADTKNNSMIAQTTSPTAITMEKDDAIIRKTLNKGVNHIAL